MEGSEARLTLAVLVGAVLLVLSSLTPSPVMAADLVQCGAGVTSKCGSKCVDWTWFGQCAEWHDLYNRTGD